MGYDADIVAFKKATLEETQKMFPDFSFDDLYTNYLLQVYEGCHNTEAESRWICSPHENIFSEFFKGNFENGEVKIINKETYQEFQKWLEDKLKSMTLYDFLDSDKDEWYIGTLINTYKSMRDKPIDFDTEFVVFQHDW